MLNSILSTSLKTVFYSLEKTKQCIQLPFLLGFLSCLLIPEISNAQYKFSYEYRTDLTFKERVELAETYFDKHGKQKGNGYKQFLRWKYWNQKQVNQDGYVISPMKAIQETEKFDRLYGGENATARQLSGNFTELGPKTTNITSSHSGALGRITCVAVANDNTFNHIIVGAHTGGVWKSTDGGTTWVSVYDNQPNLSVDAIEISHANSQHYFAAGREVGVFKSTNGGTTWTLTNGIPSFESINTIRMHPTNASILFACGKEGEIYKSVDGGSTWSSVYIHDAGLLDIEFKPNDPNTMYVSGFGFLGISTNGGTSFIPKTIPVMEDSPVMMAVSPANANYLYLLSDNNGFEGVYRSTDSGATFTTVSTNSSGENNITGPSLSASGSQAPRDMDIVVSPDNINEVHVGGIITHRSSDGGATWTQTSDWSYPNPNLPPRPYKFLHADQDQLVYIKRNGINRIYFANDGGIYYSQDGAMNFTDITNGIGARQFYRIDVSKTVKDWVIGGSQDNGTSILRSDGKWYEWLGADGGSSVVDKSDPNIMYGMENGEGVAITEDGGNTRDDLIIPTGSGEFTMPLVQDPVANNTLYLGTTQVHKSTDKGDTWTAISTFSPAQNLLFVKIAPSDPTVIYTASNNKLFKTTNGGTSWVDITPSNFTFESVNGMAIHPTTPNRLTITLSDPSDDALCIESVDGGTTWTNIANNLPLINAQPVVYEGGTKDGMYLGMLPVGLYYKDNTTGGMWQNAGTSRGLPNVTISDLVIEHQTLYVGSWGRGLWKADLSNGNSNETCIATRTITDNPATGTYVASQTITTSGMVEVTGTATFQAGNSITLAQGFHAKANSTFQATIQTCTAFQETPTVETQFKETTTLPQAIPTQLSIRPNPTPYETSFFFNLPAKEKVSLQVFGGSGQLIQTLFSNQWMDKGLHSSRFSTDGLNAGMYHVILVTGKKINAQKLVVLRN